MFKHINKNIKKETIDKANILIEALPYIKKFYNKTVVIKYGGSAMEDSDLRDKVIQDIVLLKFTGINPVIVHGGGKHINSLLTRLNIKSEFIDGLRVTDKDTMEVTQMVLAGLINKDIVSHINFNGGKAVGISGKDGNLLQGKKISKVKTDYGFVGQITKINPNLIKDLEMNNYIPVISPIAFDNKGNSLNINADIAAAELASALNAEKLIILTDVNGILSDVDDRNSYFQKLKTKDLVKLKKSGIISKGMIPKLDSCKKALERAVKKVHIINGKIPHSILLELFTEQGIGTEITK